MKNKILSLFVIVPLLANCQSQNQGFENPFPDDTFVPIGFKLDNKEKIVRSLLPAETELLDKTLLEENLNVINNVLLHEEKGEIYERDYMRAFAGEFKNGYASSNMMHNESFTAFYQEENQDNQLAYRKQIDQDITSTYQYAYGDNVANTKTRTFRYIAEKLENNMYKEVENFDEVDSQSIIERKFDVLNDKLQDVSSKIIFPLLDGKEHTKEEYLVNLTTPQSAYLFVPNSSDPIPGVTNDNRIILVREQHSPYQESGILSLQDGRQYRAVTNSVQVTRLVKENDTRKNNEDEEIGIGEYYRVEYARIYTELAITSDVIQPNVPISLLKNPIVINFKEETHEFNIKHNGVSDYVLEDVEIK